MKKRGDLYVFEGPDGVGKSTLSKWFAGHLKSTGRRVVWSSFPGRDAGTIGELVYRLHHEPARFGIPSINPLSLQLLHIASHIDAIMTRLTRSLKQGVSIVLDRFWWSTWVYGRIEGVDPETLDAMIEIEKRTWGNIKPTVVFLLQREIQGGRKRDHRLQDLYARLARREAALIRVERIHNDGSIVQAQSQILSRIP